MRILLNLLICAHMLLPVSAWAQSAVATVARDPLSVPLKQYALVLAISILGGLVSFFQKVRDGKAAVWNFYQLIGELCTSAFAGLLTYWACEYMNVPPFLMAPLVGIAGHMGTRAIQLAERAAETRYGNGKTSEPPPQGPTP